MMSTRFPMFRSRSLRFISLRPADFSVLLILFHFDVRFFSILCYFDLWTSQYYIYSTLNYSSNVTSALKIGLFDVMSFSTFGNFTHIILTLGHFGPKPFHGNLRVYTKYGIVQSSKFG